MTSDACMVLCCRYLTGQERRKCDDPGGHELRPCGQPRSAHLSPPIPPLLPGEIRHLYPDSLPFGHAFQGAER